MADIVNLNKARKNRDKALGKKQASQNRVTFGQNKSDKKADEDSAARQSKELDDRKLDGSD